MAILLLLIAFVVADIACRRADRRSERWTAHIEWEGSHYTHAAASLSDGLEWLASYPRSATGWVAHTFHGRSTTLAKRWSLA